MKKSSCQILLILVVGLCALAKNSLAAPFLVGEWGVGNFNNFSVTSTSGIFVGPGIDNFRDLDDSSLVSGWAVTSFATNSVAAIGTDRTDLMWDFHLDDSFVATQFAFDIRIYNDAALVDWATIAYNGGLYDPAQAGYTGMSKLSFWDNYTTTTHDIAAAVPEPTTMLLLGTGLASLAALGRRRRD